MKTPLWLWTAVGPQPLAHREVTMNSPSVSTLSRALKVLLLDRSLPSLFSLFPYLFPPVLCLSSKPASDSLGDEKNWGKTLPKIFPQKFSCSKGLAGSLWLREIALCLSNYQNSNTGPGSSKSKQKSIYVLFEGRKIFAVGDRLFYFHDE